MFIIGMELLAMGTINLYRWCKQLTDSKKIQRVEAE